MEKIYPIYKNADIVVLASPMYYWGISGQLKCAFDRLFVVAELTPNYENPKKDCILLMAAEGSSESNFAPVKAFYEGLTSHLGWKNIGIVYAGGNMDAGEILSKPQQLETAKVCLPQSLPDRPFYEKPVPVLPLIRAFPCFTDDTVMNRY